MWWVIYHPPLSTHTHSWQSLGGQGWDFPTPLSSESIQYSTQRGGRTETQSLGLFAPSGPLTEQERQKHIEDTYTGSLKTSPNMTHTDKQTHTAFRALTSVLSWFDFYGCIYKFFQGKRQRDNTAGNKSSHIWFWGSSMNSQVNKCSLRWQFNFKSTWALSKVLEAFWIFDLFINFLTPSYWQQPLHDLLYILNITSKLQLRGHSSGRPSGL